MGLRVWNAATLFQPSTSRESARKKWIAGRLKSAGRIIIDEGAAKALAGGASLLPAGVVRVTGVFARGDAVEIVSQSGGVIAQGLSAYDAEEISKVAGCKSEKIESLLGYRRRPAVVEKDDLVLKRSHDGDR